MTTSADTKFFSTSEEQSWVNCRLGHEFRYGCGYGAKVTNAKLSLGTIYHIGHEKFYLGFSQDDTLKAVAEAIEARREELEKGYPKGVPADLTVEFIKDSALVTEMVRDYPAWVKESGVDEGFETVSVEEALVVKFPNTDVLFRGKLDLLQRNTTTERLRIVDAKTCKNFTKDPVSYILSPQNGNYQLAVMAVYGERPTEMEYREARKMNPTTNPRSNAPYYQAVPIRLTKEEMSRRAMTYAVNANAATDPDRDIYPNPSACCGSWKNDWQTPCLAWHQGYTPLEALAQSTMFEPRNPNERYEEADTNG